jgi:hypothetical protein
MKAGSEKNLNGYAFRVCLRRGILGFAVGVFSGVGCLADLFAHLVFRLIDAVLRALRPFLARCNCAVQSVLGTSDQIIPSVVAGLRGKEHSKGRAYSDSYRKYRNGFCPIISSAHLNPPYLKRISRSLDLRLAGNAVKDASLNYAFQGNRQCPV